jgi:transcriptional antiterminator
MNDLYKIKKVLNNNVLIAISSDGKELVLIGKGIGFGKKSEAIIKADDVEKFYILSDQEEQSQYKQLVEQIDEKFIPLISEVIEYSEQALSTTLNEHIHIALTDHLAFAIRRLEQGLAIRNPFIEETKVMYPAEYLVAIEVVRRVNQVMGVSLPEGEIGFVALHLHSAMTNRSLSSINQYSKLVSKLVNLIELELDVQVDHESINYLRLVQHIKNAIIRVEQGEVAHQQIKLADVLKSEYPICYNLAWKLIKVMQKTLNKPVSEAEAVYLTLHLQRLSPR